MNEHISDSVSDEIISICEKIVMSEGIKKLNVRRVIKEMNVTNRVFYNRFSNIDEVLEIIYYKNMSDMQKSLHSDKDITHDFFGYATDVAINALLNNYRVKQKFCQYMFELDSYTNTYCIWWIEQIKDMVRIAKETNQIKQDVDPDMLSYAIWCFLHGFNNDAVNRNISAEEAIDSLKFGLNCIFYGIKN